jgi:hypothetical protein
MGCHKYSFSPSDSSTLVGIENDIKVGAGWAV